MRGAYENTWKSILNPGKKNHSLDVWWTRRYKKKRGKRAVDGVEKNESGRGLGDDDSLKMKSQHQNPQVDGEGWKSSLLFLTGQDLSRRVNRYAQEGKKSENACPAWRS